MSSQPSPLPQKQTRYVVVYNLVLAVLMSYGLYHVMLTAAYSDMKHQRAVAKEQRISQMANQPAPAVVQKTDSNNAKIDSPSTMSEIREPSASESAETSESELSDTTIPANLEMISFVLWSVLLAGGLGGTLSNLRGIFEYYRDYTFLPEHLELPFYIRPVSGAICGLFTFFLARFFTIALSSGENLSSWQTLEGMVPYVGVALIAGFASQEFMERLRETAKTLFGTPPPTAQTESTMIETTTADTTDDDNSNLIRESISGGTRGGGSTSGTTQTQSRQVVVVKPSGPIRRAD